MKENRGLIIIFNFLFFKKGNLCLIITEIVQNLVFRKAFTGWLMWSPPKSA